MKQIHEGVAKSATWAFALLGWMLGSCALAQSRPQPPDVLSFRGTLVAADGTLVGASGPVNVPIIFRVFTQATGGKLLWSEQQTLAVRSGVFSAMLGEGNIYANEPRPALSSLFAASDASDRYVEVTVRGMAAGEADAVVEPRTRLVSGAYALLASRALTAEDMVNAEGQSLLTPLGNRVGINQANPQANLDVAGSMAGRNLEVRETLSVTGIAEGAGFNGLGMAPVGSILMWTGTTPPKGWVLCDGSVVGGVTTPDLRGRFVLGVGNGQRLTPRSLHQRGGTEAHALGLAEIPPHSHWVSVSGSLGPSSAGEHIYRTANAGYTMPSDGSHRPVRSNLGNSSTDTAGNHTHAIVIPPFASATQGEGRPHNTMPPFYVLAFIMRVQ